MHSQILSMSGAVQPVLHLGASGTARPVPLQELREALAGARLRTCYQPIVRIADRKPVTLEVLARLDHPVRGLVAPDLFVPQYEAAGLAWPMTEAVVRRSFAEWTSAGLDRLGLGLALNFPLDGLLIPQALRWLDEQRQEAGIAATSITIELTESRPVTRLAELRAATTRLRRAGYGLSIDDVGPNVRDHRELLKLPFSALKLDKDVVQDSPRFPEARRFLDTAITAARAAGMTVVAEGVSDGALWNRMAELSIDHAQGFLVGRPMPAAAVAEWHAEWCGRAVSA